MKKHYFYIGLLSLVGGFIGSLFFYAIDAIRAEELSLQHSNNPKILFNKHTYNSNIAYSSVDFISASENCSPSVVFIRTKSEYRRRTDDFWDLWDFWGRKWQISSAGSGVIVSNDGYIVTNNHVIDQADVIEVVLNSKKTYKAKIVGTDPNTDLALIKIESNNLPAIKFANSDWVKIGEWVLAVGNPLNLTSTVTAGIVSAKGRNINVVKTQFPIESFIQTDAAINPGNSGGALVNTKGELVGINTAIASKTGAYSGYGFAIPSNIVNKVIKDIKEFGEVQRVFLGAEVTDLDAELAEKIKDNDLIGVYIYEVTSNGAADQAGLNVGDIIISINDLQINSKAEFMERLSYFRPGDIANLIIKRNGSSQKIRLTLTNREGTTELLKNESLYSAPLGCIITPLSKVEKQKLNLNNGFRISDIRGGRIRNMGLPDGFIIISVNNKVPQNTQDLENLINRIKGRIIIEGINPNGVRGFYSFYAY